MADQVIRIDPFTPAEMAERAENVGVAKANLDGLVMFALAILAGAFIGLGAIFMTTVTTGAAALPFGVGRLLGGLVFCLGLILVVVAGAELFTGNNLIIMAFANGKVPLSKLLRNWGIVYAGNFVGSVATAAVMFISKQYALIGGGALGLNALNVANYKCGLEFLPALGLGIMCNALVCLAVWLCFSARSTTDKILSIVFPITAFVAAGFEHSVANMYFIPIGLFIQWFDPAFTADAVSKGAKVANLTMVKFLIGNLLPVTIGNIIGGAGMVGLVYWFIYLRPKRQAAAAAAAATAKK
ncbi:MAG TPA: formate transporter FocA [Anaerolineae bacterium]|nr:formate transporter FocA [Anaerolineae bacterium]HOR01417.1 formate transporter FocA [Anaerolineae bacterium]HPL27193.1 formate transporter FocA [Anaerolineae bacterium]